MSLNLDDFKLEKSGSSTPKKDKKEGLNLADFKLDKTPAKLNTPDVESKVQEDEKKRGSYDGDGGLFGRVVDTLSDTPLFREASEYLATSKERGEYPKRLNDKGQKLDTLTEELTALSEKIDKFPEQFEDKTHLEWANGLIRGYNQKVKEYEKTYSEFKTLHEGGAPETFGTHTAELVFGNLREVHDSVVERLSNTTFFTEAAQGLDISREEEESGEIARGQYDGDGGLFGRATKDVEGLLSATTEVSKSFSGRGTSNIIKSIVSSPLNFTSRMIYGESNPLGDFLSDFADTMHSEYSTETSRRATEEEFSLEKAKSTDFWLTTIAENVPVTLVYASLARPIVGSVATSSSARVYNWLTKLNASSKFIEVASKTVGMGAGITAGSMAMRSMESSAEAEEVYHNAIARGDSEEEALRMSAEAFTNDMKLLGLDAIELASIVLGGNGNKSTILSAILREVIGLAVGSVSEGYEEVYQYGVQERALGNTDASSIELILTDPRAQEAGFIGAIMGLIFQGGGRIAEIRDEKAREAYMDRIADRLPPELKKKYDDVKGVDEKQKILDSIAETDVSAIENAVRTVEREVGDDAKATKDAIQEVRNVATEKNRAENLLTEGASREEVIYEIANVLGVDVATKIVDQVIPEVNKRMEKEDIKARAKNAVKKVKETAEEFEQQSKTDEEMTVEELSKEIEGLKDEVKKAKNGSEEKKSLKIRLSERKAILEEKKTTLKDDEATKAKTYKIQVYDESGKPTKEDTEVLYEGTIGDIPVFVHKAKNGGFGVSHSASGLLIGSPTNNRLSKPESILKNVVEDLKRQTGKTDEEIAEMVREAGNKKEIVNEVKSEEIITPIEDQEKKARELATKQQRKSQKEKETRKGEGIAVLTLDKSITSTNNNDNEDTQDTGSGADKGTVPQTKQVGGKKSARSKGDNAESREVREGSELRDDSSESGERPSTRLTNEQVAERVSEITEISSTGEVILVGEVTEEMREVANQYEPEGKSKEGRGVLDEYYTNTQIVDMVKSLFDFEWVSGLKVLEPSVGVGNFLYALPDVGKHTVDTFEINPTTARIAKIFHPSAKVSTNSFETLFIDERGNKKDLSGEYDIVLGNPPYGDHRGKYRGLGEEKGISKYEEYFIKRGLDVLKKGGTLVMVVPSSFLRTGENEAKVSIANIGKLVDAYRLPNGVFESTDVGTDVVVFKKRDEGKDTTDVVSLVSDNYFKENPNKILGTTKKRKNRFGKMEDYVEGSIDDAINTFNQVRSNSEAIRVLSEAGGTVTKEDIENVSDAIEEGVSKEDAVKRAREKSTGKKTIQNKVKKGVTKKGETIKLDEQFLGEYSESELELWRKTEPDGSIFLPDDEIQANADALNYEYGKWYVDFNYAQGDIYEKLDTLERDFQGKKIDKARYEAQKKKLEDVLPKREGIDEIDISPNSAFATKVELGIDGNTGKPITLQSQFLQWIRTLPRQTFGNSNEWEVRAYVKNEQVRGNDKARNEKIREQRKRVAHDLFRKFLKEGLEADQRDMVEDEYNRSFNFYHTPDYRKVPMFGEVHSNLNIITKKEAPFEVRDVQKEGVGRLVNKGVGILAHEVGFGKTISGVLAMNEIMQRGWSKRPLVVAPNENVYQQWVNTITDVIPGAKLNLLGNLGAQYKGDLSELSIPEGTFTLVTYEGLKRLSFKDDTYSQLAFDFAYLSDELGKAKTERGKQKQVSRTEELGGTMKKGTRADLFFEDLGFDLLTFDEIHNANHIVSKVKLEKGEASEFNRFSLRPSDLGMKTWVASQYIQSQNGGRNVIGLSATPFTNHPLEYYSVLSLVADKTISKMGFYKVGEFFNTFMEAEHEYEFKADGTYQKKTDIRSFKNYRQFRKLLNTYIDFRSGDTAGIKRPNRVQREYSIPANDFTLEMEAKAQEIFKEDERQGGKGAKTLRAINELRKIAFSPYASKFSEEPTSYKEFIENSPKLKTLMALIEQNKKDKGEAGQIVYLDNVGIQYMPLMREYLERELGYKKGEVEIISGGIAKTKRLAIQEKYNNGYIKIILGSEAIKEGMNLQENTTDMYVLALPWNFTQMRQVIGRAWRQGNSWANVRINNLFIEDSVDVFQSQKLENKQRRYEASIKSGDQSVDVGDISYADLKFDLIRDPGTRARLELQAEQEELAQKIAQAQADLAFSTRKLEKVATIEAELARDRQSLKDEQGSTEKSDWWIEKLTEDIKKNTKRLADEKKKIEERGEDLKSLEERKRNMEEEIQALRQTETELSENFDVRKAEIEATLPERVPFSDDLVAKFVAERAEHNKTFFVKAEEESDSEVKFETIDKPIKSTSGKVVKTKKITNAVVKKQPKKKLSRDDEMIKIITDSTLSSQEKVDTLLSKKQEWKKFKDAGERVAGSKKENAVIQAVIKYGNNEVLRQIAKELGIEVVISQLNKQKILEEVEVPTRELEESKGTPAWIAGYKVKVYNTIAKTPQLKTKDGKYSQYINVDETQMDEFISKYPELLQGFVKELNAISNGEEFEVFKDKYKWDFTNIADRVVNIYVIGGKAMRSAILGEGGAKGAKFEIEKIKENIAIAENGFVEDMWNNENYKGLTDSYYYGALSAKYFDTKDEAMNSTKNALKNGKEDIVSGWEEELKGFDTDYDKYVPEKNAGKEVQLERAQNNVQYFEQSIKSIKDTLSAEPDNEYIKKRLEVGEKNLKEAKAFLARLKGEADTLTHGNFKEIEEYDVKDSRFKKSQINSDNLMKTYGFKSTQLGNYMDDASSKEHIVQTMASMEDMSAILEVDFPAIANKFGLSIAFGARGGGSANAHYEPTHKIINLTKKRGDGSFGHEFMHFLDHTIGSATKRGKWSGKGSRRGRYFGSVPTDLPSLDITDAILSGINIPETKEFTPSEDVDLENDTFGYREQNINLRKNGKTFEEAVASVRRNDYNANERYQAIADVYKKTVQGEIVNRSSEYYANSVSFGGGVGSYWARPNELWARAFQSYLEDKMEEKGVKNNYLTRTTKDLPVYPQGAERKELNKLFDKLFDGVRQEYPLTEDMNIQDPRFKLFGIPTHKLTEAGEYLEDAKKRLGLEFNVMWVDNILTVDNQSAYGITYDNTIAIVKNLSDTTGAHELVHLTLANIEKIDAFKGMTKEDILGDKAKEIGIEYNEKTANYIEEQLAIDFEEFVAERHKPQGRIERFFKKLLRLLQQLARALVNTDGSIVRDYYEVLDSGKSVDSEMVELEEHGILESFVENGVLNLSQVRSPKAKHTITLKARDIKVNSFDLNNARADYKNGIRSQTKSNIQVMWHKGAYHITDGHHRYIEGLARGKNTFVVDVMPLRFKLKEDKHFKNYKQKHNEIVTQLNNTKEKLDKTREQLARAIDMRGNKKDAIADIVSEVGDFRKYLTKEQVLSETGVKVAEELGYNPKEINVMLSDYLKSKKEWEDMHEQVVAQREEISNMRKESKGLAQERREIERKIRQKKQKLEQIQKGVEQGFRQGFHAMEKANALRRFQVRRVQDATGITHAQLKRLIGNRNFETMSDQDFKNFMENMITRAHDFTKKEGLQREILSEIQYKQYQKFDNLRLALGLPTPKAMNDTQLEQYRDALRMYNEGDVFLSRRLQETLHRTDFGSIRTIREFYERAEKMGISREDIMDAKVSNYDDIKNDVLLARKNTIYKFVIERKHQALIEAQEEMNIIHKDLEEKVKKARASRRKRMSFSERIIDYIVPTDELVFNFIESDNKEKYLKKNPLTDEEMDLAVYLITLFAKARDYLVDEYKMGSRFMSDNYITHTRRSFLEILKTEKNLKTVIIEAYRSSKDNQAGTEILAGDTGDILAFEKFFGFSLRRSGEIVPTKNIAKATEAYFRAFTKKKALDKLIPTAILIAKQSDAEKATTQKGVQKTLSLEKFMKRYLNNVKGRTIGSGVLQQNSALDVVLKGVGSLIYINFLAYAVAINIASFGGEFVTVMKALSWQERINFFKRIVNLPRNKKMHEAIHGVTGRNPIVELFDQGHNISHIIGGLMFIGFAVSGHRGTKGFFRGALTDEEYNLGQVSLERLAELELRMQTSRKGVRGYGSSLYGSHFLARHLLIFKSWALPILTTLSSDMVQLAKKLPKRTFNENMTSEEVKSIYGFVEVAALSWAIITVLKNFIECDDDDNELLCATYKKVMRDFNTLYESLGTFWGTTAIPVSLSFVTELQEIISEIVSMERYKTDGVGYSKGDLKGTRHLGKFITPTVVRQFQGAEERVDSEEERVREGIESGDFNAKEISDFLYGEYGDSTQREQYKEDKEYQDKRIGEIEALYHIRKEYGYDNEIVNVLLGTGTNQEKVLQLKDYSERIGNERARTEILKLKTDKNTCSDPIKKTGCLVSGALWKDYKKSLPQ